MSIFNRIAEEKIREAMEKGEFDNLSGRGKPLDMTAYFATPPHLRLGYSVLKSGGFVPEEVQLLKEAEALRERMEASSDPEERKRLARQVDDCVLKFEILKEYYKKNRRSY
jgi:hypothetical protein